MTLKMEAQDDGVGRVVAWDTQCGSVDSVDKALPSDGIRMPGTYRF